MRGGELAIQEKKGLFTLFTKEISLFSHKDARKWRDKHQEIKSV